MTRMSIYLATLAVVFCLVATPTQAVRGQTPSDTIDVLFIGNSYIYVNNLPGMIEGISQALEGPVVRTGIHTHGGFTLRQHLEDGHISEVLSEGSWDRVVLQEQSALGTAFADTISGRLGDPASFHDATRVLDTMIREQDATPLLYMTWAKKRFPIQSVDLANAYDAIGTELTIPVAPVGTAWARVVRERPGVGLFLSDGSHPNAAGSYLAACVIYALLTKRSPVGAPPEIAGIPWDFSGVMDSDTPTILVSLAPENARYLQQAAWEAVASRSAR